MMFKTEKFLIIIALMFLTFALIKADKKDKDSRKEGLRWFNASVQEDCNEIPEQLEIRQGKPSNACKEDEERFCLCGLVGKGEKATWRFLCGTCKVSFSFKL